MTSDIRSKLPKKVYCWKCKMKVRSCEHTYPSGSYLEGQSE